jgi:hypothetical protein
MVALLESQTGKTRHPVSRCQDVTCLLPFSLIEPSQKRRLFGSEENGKRIEKSRKILSRLISELMIGFPVSVLGGHGGSQLGSNVEHQRMLAGRECHGSCSLFIGWTGLPRW